MDENSTFIGIGRNPDGPDLPLGFGMQLAQEPKAMNTFGRLSREEKIALIGYIQSCSTGEDAKNRIAETVKKLGDGQTSFRR